MADDFAKYVPMLEEMYVRWARDKERQKHLDLLWPHLKDHWDPENTPSMEELMAMTVETAKKYRPKKGA